MKVLSIRQPWAWAIIHAGKDIENRSWPTRFRGRFLVHAAPFPKGLTMPAFDQFPRGGIIGSVDLVDCVADYYDSPWFFGRYGFVLANPEPLPFRPLKGKLGFFETDVMDSLATPEAK